MPAQKPKISSLTSTQSLTTSSSSKRGLSITPKTTSTWVSQTLKNGPSQTRKSSEPQEVEENLPVDPTPEKKVRTRKTKKSQEEPSSTQDGESVEPTERKETTTSRKKKTVPANEDSVEALDQEFLQDNGEGEAIRENKSNNEEENEEDDDEEDMEKEKIGKLVEGVSKKEWMERIAKEKGLSMGQVPNTLRLLFVEQATLAFISRYRKEQTGSLKEEEINNLKEVYEILVSVETRKQTVLSQIAKQGKLRRQLEQQIRYATRLSQIEDLYLPYKQKKKALAQKETGLLPLAEQIISDLQKGERYLNIVHPSSSQLNLLSSDYINPEKGFGTIEEILTGVKHILTEKMTDCVPLRDYLRSLLISSEKIHDLKFFQTLCFLVIKYPMNHEAGASVSSVSAGGLIVKTGSNTSPRSKSSSFPPSTPPTTQQPTELSGDALHAIALYQAGQLDPRYPGDSKLCNLGDHPYQEQKIGGMVDSGHYALIEIHAANSPYTHHLVPQNTLKGGRSFDETLRLLDNALQHNQRVVFVSYRWSDHNDPQVDRLCDGLTLAGFVVLRDRQSFEINERIDDYMALIKNHPAVVQTIILADKDEGRGCYVKSRNCMNEMQLAFRNSHLAKQHVTIIPLAEGGIQEYIQQSDAVLQDWTKRRDTFCQDGNPIEAQLAEQIIQCWPAFVTRLRLQNHPTLFEFERHGYSELIRRIAETPFLTASQQTLPFQADPYYQPQVMNEATLTRELAPGKAILVRAGANIGKTHFIQHTFLQLGQDVFHLFPGGVVMVSGQGKTKDELLQGLPNPERPTLLIIDNVDQATVTHQDLRPWLQKHGLIMTSQQESLMDGTTIRLLRPTSKQKRELLNTILTDYRPPKTDGQLQTIVEHSRTLGDVSRFGQYVLRTQMSMERFLNALATDPDAIRERTGVLIRRISRAAVQSSATVALAHAVTNQQKAVLFIAATQTVDGVEKRCGHEVGDFLRQAGMVVIGQQAGYADYLSILNHQGLVQVILVVDDTFLRDAACMRAMAAVFRNPHLITGRVIIIPTEGRLYVAYQHNLGELNVYWGAQPEAEIIQPKLPAFLRTMGLQKSQTLEEVMSEEGVSLIETIEHLPPLPSIVLPWRVDPNYIGRQDEQEQIAQWLSPGQMITVIGEGGLGKSALVRQTLACRPQDVAILAPDGVIVIDFEEGLSAAEAQERIVRTLEPENNGQDIAGSYQRLLNTRKMLILLDAIENVSAESLKILFVSTLKPSIMVLTTRRGRGSDAPAESHRLHLTPLSKDDERSLLLRYHPAGIEPDARLLEHVLTLLGGQPLAITLAGAYLQGQQGSLSELHRLLQANPAALGGQVKVLTAHHLAQLNQHRFQAVIDSVLAVLGQMANAPLPYERLKGIIIRQFSEQRFDDLMVYDEVLRPLQELGLIKKVDEEDQLTVMHPLVYGFLHEHFRLTPALETAVEAEYDGWLTGEPAQWSQIKAHLPHLPSALQDRLLGHCVDALTAPEAAAKRRAIGIICGFAADYDNRVRLMRILRITERVVNLLADADRLVQAYAALTVRYFAFEADQRVKIGRIEGALNGLVDMLRNEEAGCRENAARALWILAVDNSENQVAIGQIEGALNGLVDMLRNEEVGCREKAAGALCILAADNSENQVAIGQIEGALNGLVDMLRNEEVGCRENAAGALWILAVHPENQVAIGQIEGALNGLVDMLRNEEAGCRENAAGVLSNLAVHPENRLKLAAIPNLRAHLVNLRNDPDNAVKAQATRALNNLDQKETCIIL